MQTLETLGKKIKTVGDLLAVVKTMKALAAVNIRTYEAAAQAVEQYDQVITQGWRALLPAHGLLARAKRNNRPAAALLVLGSDQGMCGQFNDAVLQLAQREAKTLGNLGRLHIWPCGERIRAALEDSSLVHAQDYGLKLPGSVTGIEPFVREAVTSIEQARREQGVETVVILANRPVGSSYQPWSRRLLPLDREWLEEVAARPWPRRSLPLIGAGPTESFAGLFRERLFVSLYRLAALSMAAENAARLAAMQAAEKNIQELREDLNAAFRDTRQNAITAELLDIVSGFEALGG